MKIINAAVFSSLLLLALAAAAGNEIHQSMTVEEAYATIPHQHPIFDMSSANMNEQEKKFLQALFALTDKAVVERVVAQKNIGLVDPKTGNYNAILEGLGALQVPGKLEKTHQLVTQAVQEQRDYLILLAKGEGFNPGAPLVQSSHGKLLAAYNELMRLYPDDSRNKQAFFDFLCALDFI